MAAIMVMNPVMSHTSMSQPALPTFLTISALTIKIPDPIMDPATTMVASNNPKLGLNEVCSDMLLIKQFEEKKIPDLHREDKEIYGTLRPYQPAVQLFFAAFLI